MANRRSNPSSPLILQSTFLFILSICFLEVHGLTNQADALEKLYRAKLFDRSSTIDSSSNFDLVDEAFTQDLHESTEEYSTITYSHKLSRAKDKIVKLPGQPPVNFDQYGGYVTVDVSKGRAFYYYFVEVPKSKGPLPLLLWLNGGPGCSSLAYGAMQELGPFRVASDGKTLFRNPYSWNNAANVLFLESPAGVGFSYSNTTSDYKSNGDRTTAADNYWFIRKWLQRFPEYKNRDLYIAGESYAGHYVPQLAHFILAMNKRVGKHSIINLKGIMIGNAVINDETDTRGMYDFFWTHALISDQTYNTMMDMCNFASNANNSDQCLDAANAASEAISSLDIYNIYAPLCHSPNVTAEPKKASVRNFDPCSDYYVYAYLNTPEVQAALHANVTKLSHDWQPCSDIITDWVDSATTVIPLLHEFMANRLRVWIFSGDTDGRVPVTSTRYSINKMNLTTKMAWYPWFLDEEVGGYAQVYRGSGDLTFATVRGAGHQVPSYQPKRALSLVSYFLSGFSLPTGS